MSTARQCQPFVTFFVNGLNPVEPGLTGFKQLIYYVLSSWFAAKSVEQMIVEHSNFEQFTPTLLHSLAIHNNFFVKGYWIQKVFKGRLFQIKILTTSTTFRYIYKKSIIGPSLFFEDFSPKNLKFRSLPRQHKPETTTKKEQHQQHNNNSSNISNM